MPNIVVSRERTMAGGGLAFNVIVNGTRVGQVKNGESQTFTVPPGPIDIRLTWSLPLGNANSKSLQIPNSAPQDVFRVICRGRNQFFRNVIDVGFE